MRQLKITNSITVRDASLEKYLQDISKEELITTEEEVELAQRIRNGDERAKDKLVRANLRFVVSVAKQYQNKGMSLTDLINEGNLGLIKAAERFDETRGFKFISFAVWWVRQSIQQALSEQSRIVRVPLNQVGLQNKIKRAISSFEQEFGRRPSVEELAEKMDVSEDKIAEVLEIPDQIKSLDAPFGEDGDGSLGDVLENTDSPRADSSVMRDSLRREIERALSTLTEKEREVLKMSFGLGDAQELSLDEIGLRFDLTRERVRQIKEKAIVKLRQNSSNNLLKSFLG
ncbi:MAG: RNA polymerase sigma factor RpoD/SigA [Paludibacteraceae bacterium]|nr:RNA polymerase sigma factor RpoD/SigA [Paludibacteraceae bacterium]MBO7635518.1 RNA polymerase sigma factor RpoD/SigA [Paludibacteraceae bacterium]MBR5972472.1 RNA polymerase sigma factor RpoD/SigA [Paludibacteraceae bacterium]